MIGVVTGTVRPLRRVLIANRGEIAIRIAKAADGLGIESVAIYPPADERSLHTRVTTERRALAAGADPDRRLPGRRGGRRPRCRAGCDSVHPGYGFLAENAAFAERCAAAGITFVGPRAETLALFGDKVAARTLASSLGIPIIEGSATAVDTVADAATVADDIGYPVMLKAAAGGGGRGMRAVTRPEDLADAFDRCRGEATAAFGNGALFVERLLPRPRHIEVQILADTHGHVVHLFDRDCSVQLRNQKVIEVAPAPGLEPGLRERIFADAIALAESSSYVNAGTVEFLVSPETGDHFFIECNPRIQVEHTVTEQVTGVDLVEAQFRIAGGASLADLGLGDQADVVARGYAVQARLVATGTGTLTAYQEPSGAGVRVDAAGYVGYAPPPQFDPLLAKVIATSASGDVAAAVDRTRRAVESFHLAGLPTNRAQLLAILARPEVRAGDARTTLLAEVPELVAATSSADAPLATLGGGGRQRCAAGGPGHGRRWPSDRTRQAARSPMGSAVVEVRVGVGDLVGPATDCSSSAR